jgi:hypothetical protein
MSAGGPGIFPECVIGRCRTSDSLGAACGPVTSSEATPT